MWCPYLRASETFFLIHISFYPEGKEPLEPCWGQSVGGCWEIAISWAGVCQGDGLILGKESIYGI